VHGAAGGGDLPCWGARDWRRAMTHSKTMALADSDETLVADALGVGTT
jgi:hypothetical protein